MFASGRSPRKLDIDIKWAYQHYVYLLRTASGLAVQYKAVPDGRTALAGQDVWNALVTASRAVSSGGLAPEYVGELITTGGFGRDLTPKELFALPYSNPTWPMVATVDDMRQALFRLATSSEWMLTDSDRSEIRPASPGQIQPASVQQLLRPRPAMVSKPESTPTQASNQEGDYPRPHHLTGGPESTLYPATLTPSGEAAGGDPSERQHMR